MSGAYGGAEGTDEQFAFLLYEEGPPASDGIDEIVGCVCLRSSTDDETKIYWMVHIKRKENGFRLENALEWSCLAEVKEVCM